MKHWLALWDHLDGNFWACCRAFAQEFTPEQLAWQPVRDVASIGWNLRHLGEMLDQYLTKVFRAQPATTSREPLVTMLTDSRDDGRFGDLAAIAEYHRQVRPAYRRFLASLKEADLDRPMSPRPNAPTLAWAVGHIAEHESYHHGKCTLLRTLLRARGP